MSVGAKRKVAAFDFDGTLAKGDSLLPFLHQLLGKPRMARSVLAHAIPLALIGLGRGDRDATKESFIAHALTGQKESDVRELGQAFAAELLEKQMLQPAMDKVHWHKNSGHQLVLVSASIDVYLHPLCDLLGFDHAITTRLQIVDGRTTGRLVGGNVRAGAKARLVSEWLAGEDAELWAYGNSSGDYELLEMADHPHWVTKDGSLAPWSGRP